MAEVLGIGVDEPGSVLGSNAAIGILTSIVRLWVAGHILLRLTSALEISSAGVPRRGSGSPNVGGRSISTGAVARIQTISGAWAGRDAVDGAALHGRDLGTDCVSRVVEAAGESRGSSIAHPRLGARVELERL